MYARTVLNQLEKQEILTTSVLSKKDASALVLTEQEFTSPKQSRLHKRVGSARIEDEDIERFLQLMRYSSQTVQCI